MSENSPIYGKPWSREELILAMNLYCRIPFGRQHSKSAEVIELAEILGRSPGSVAMKLNNFTSLDPEELARGIRGLARTSKLDRQIWDEFHEDWEALAVESEILWQQRVNVQTDASCVSETIITPHPIRENANLIIPKVRDRLDGPTEGERIVRIRYAQNFFRRTVLVAYGIQCCISGIPIPELLIASHILPWSSFPEHRINPHNGICLSRLHDAAFDRGLITFDDNNRLVISSELRKYLPHESLNKNFIVYEGTSINLPEKFLPDQQFLSYHRENIYRE
jgi:predicted restriction endonuclease